MEIYDRVTISLWNLTTFWISRMYKEIDKLAYWNTLTAFYIKKYCYFLITEKLNTYDNITCVR